MDQTLPLPSPDGQFGPSDARLWARCWPAVVQGAFALLAIGGLIAAPPASGRMLLVPLDGAGRDGLARAATQAGVALVDVGPFSDSLIVSGERSALLGAMMRGHMLVLRAADGGCDGKTVQGQVREL